MRVTLTIGRRVPPHQARADAHSFGGTRIVEDSEIPGEVALALAEARATQVFEANGCLVFTIQRAPAKVAP